MDTWQTTDPRGSVVRLISPVINKFTHLLSLSSYTPCNHRVRHPGGRIKDRVRAKSDRWKTGPTETLCRDCLFYFVTDTRPQRPFKKQKDYFFVFYPIVLSKTGNKKGEEGRTLYLSTLQSFTSSVECWCSVVYTSVYGGSVPTTTSSPFLSARTQGLCNPSIKGSGPDGWRDRKHNRLCLFTEKQIDS